MKYDRDNRISLGVRVRARVYGVRNKRLLEIGFCIRVPYAHMNTRINIYIYISVCVLYTTEHTMYVRPCMSDACVSVRVCVSVRSSVCNTRTAYTRTI